MNFNNLYIRPCVRNDLNSVLALQDDVFRILPDETLLRRNTPELLALGLTYPNLTVGVFDGQMLVAIGMLVDPKPPETDLRIGLQRFSVDKALDMKLVMVHGDYRGHGFQKALMWISEKMAYMNGCTHLCTSVSPDNRFSLRNVSAMDYQFDHTEELYNGLLRNVYVKKIKVADYFQKVFLTAGRYENRQFLSPVVDISGCMPGDINLCCPGDVAVYIKKDTGESVYGLLIWQSALLVLLPDENNVWKIMPFARKISDRFILDKVLINTTDSIPFHEV